MSKRFPPNLVRDALSEVSSSKYGLDDTSSPKYPLFTVPYKEYLPNVGKFLVRSALAVVAWTVWKCHSYPSRPKPHSSAYSVFTNPSITLSDAILQYLLPLLLPVGVMMEGEEGLKEGRRKVESLSEMNWRDGVERLGLEVEKVRGEEEWRRRRGGGEEGRRFKGTKKFNRPWMPIKLTLLAPPPSPQRKSSKSSVPYLLASPSTPPPPPPPPSPPLFSCCPSWRRPRFRLPLWG